MCRCAIGCRPCTSCARRKKGISAAISFTGPWASPSRPHGSCRIAFARRCASSALSRWAALARSSRSTKPSSAASKDMPTKPHPAAQSAYKNAVLVACRARRRGSQLPCRRTTSGQLLPIIRANIAARSCIMTDKAGLLRARRTNSPSHETRQSRADEYVRGDRPHQHRRRLFTRSSSAA